MKPRRLGLSRDHAWCVDVRAPALARACVRVHMNCHRELCIHVYMRGLPFKCPEGWTPDGSRWWDPPLTKRGKAQAKKS
eukprot:1378621-Amorphochlora_amoeboformis.AAC.1